VISAAKGLDSEVYRGAYFDSLDAAREFSIATHGREKYVVINSDNAISKGLFVKGSFDFDKVEMALAILKGRNPAFVLETLIDVGANIGTVCIPTVKRGFAARAIAIEPEPLNYRVLMANIFLNNLADRIVAHNLALGAENDKTLELELAAGHSGDHRVYVPDQQAGRDKHPPGNTTRVRSETFDKVVPKVAKSSCLVWMDTQGYEGIILKGAQHALSARIPMVIEFWPQGMKEMGSYGNLRDALSNYAEYFDLSESQPQPIKVSPEALDRLYEQLGDNGRWTDILLV
jgi:FkbM family methyltransferase